MTFLNPVFLWLLPLLAIPVIIHLLAKRKSRLIDFPSLKFLKLLEQDALRKFNLKQLILLILRTLMILLLILAFTRPSLNLDHRFSLNLGSPNLMVFLVDNTASNFDNFEDVVAPWIKDLALQLQEKDYEVFFADLNSLTLGKNWGAIRGGYGTAYPGEALSRLADQIELERYTEKALLWIGDGQHAQAFTQNLVDWDVYIFTQPVSRDFGINSIELPQRGVRLGQELDLTINLCNGPEDDTDQTLELSLNEERQNQRIIEPGMSSVSMTLQIKEAGIQSGRLNLGDDQYPYNDIRHFVLPAQGRIPFQVLREMKGVDFWAVVAAALEQLSMNLDVRLVDAANADDLDLGRGGTVIVEDAAAVADYTWARFKGFLERGGQLVLFGNGGPQMAELLKFDGKLEAQRFETSLFLKMTASGRQTLAMPPLEKVVAEQRLKIFKRYTTTGDELQRTWIRFADDQPFAGSSTYGNGQVIWFNTDFGGVASNLPLLGVFPPLMVHLGQAVKNTDRTADYNFIVGDTIRFQPEAADRNEPFAISRPDGTMEYANPDSNFVLAYGNTDIPGIYQLQRGRQVVQAVAVNIAAAEASAHRESYNFGETNNFHTTVPTELIKEVLENQTGLPLWPILLILLLLVWLVETYLSRIRNTWRQHD